MLKTLMGLTEKIANKIYSSAQSFFNNYTLGKFLKKKFYKKLCTLYNFILKGIKIFKKILLKLENFKDLVFSIFFKNINYVYLYLSFILFCWIWLLVTLWIILPQNLLFTFGIFTLIYLVTNIWYYFINIYENSNYTSLIQRFWKRTFLLFWLIEWFLFIFLTWLWFVSPYEITYYKNPFSQNSIRFLLTYSDLNNVLYLLITYIALVLVSHYKNTKSSILIWLFGVIIIISLIILFEEYYNVVATVNSLTKEVAIYNECVISESDKKIYLAVENSEEELIYWFLPTDKLFVYMFMLLRFWHILLITFLTLLVSLKYIATKSVSQCQLSSLRQNNMYVIYFFLLHFILANKVYWLHYMRYSYYWLLECPNKSNYLVDVINEIAIHLSNLF